MGLLQSYATLSIKHPCKILLLVPLIVLTLFISTLLIRSPPSFKDPLVGFEARDTLVSSRLNTWKILVGETSGSASNISLVTDSPTYEGRYYISNNLGESTSDNNHDDNNSLTANNEPPLVDSLLQFGDADTNGQDWMDEDEDEYYKSINSTKSDMSSLMHYSLGSSKAFCGKLYEGYAQVVVSTSFRYSSSGLFNLNSILAICELDRRLRLEQSAEDRVVFQRDCEQIQLSAPDLDGKTSTCCNSWSLPNFIACINNKTTCMDISASDMRNTELLLNQCAPYYYKTPYEECFTNSTKDDGHQPIDILTPATHNLNSKFRSQCRKVPDKCLKCDGWIYFVLHYLTNEGFYHHRTNLDRLKTNKQSSSKLDSKNSRNTYGYKTSSNVGKLTYTNIFLPAAKSGSLMKYYNTLSKYNLRTPHAQVKAMNLGLKNSLFEQLISEDSKLFAVALITILVVITFYTWSFIMSFVILIVICLSLCLAYVIYELILGIPIFPFMNLLAVVISFGICSDNAMLFCNHWSKQEDCTETEVQTDKETDTKVRASMDRLMRKAVLSTLAATLATSCSFIISALSKVTAVRCFCIFATLSVLTNYLLIILLLPPALIVDAAVVEYINLKLSNGLGANSEVVKKLLIHLQVTKRRIITVGRLFHEHYIFTTVTEYKLYLIITYITILACSSILVFHKPTLQPADQEDIPLLSKRHAFEQYDKNLRKQFAFERSKFGESTAHGTPQITDYTETLPIRIVFGLKPVDNGNHLDPQDRGSLVFDPTFDFADSHAQVWLLEFCQRIRQQRFMHPTAVPDISSCFIDTFKLWMDARTCQDPMRPEIDRSPCCQSFEFPYTPSTINKCIGEAVNSMRRTPQLSSIPNPAIYFFKNTTRVAAVILEYQSNRLYTESFTKMEQFFTDIDEWVTWQINNTAPKSLKSGWFISSNLELYALQTELEQSTLSSILLEVLFAMSAIMISTRNITITIAGTLAISTIIIVTVSILIALRWTLGVAESILISLTIGLSIDFALHYCVAYGESRKSSSSRGVVQRILSEVGSPIALATTTTTLAGFVIVWSDILAYQELGVFLMVIATISWLTSTFFLLPMLATVDSMIEQKDALERMLIRRALRILLDHTPT